jgi:hypothetical protein
MKNLLQFYVFSNFTVPLSTLQAARDSPFASSSMNLVLVILWRDDAARLNSKMREKNADLRVLNFIRHHRFVVNEVVGAGERRGALKRPRFAAAPVPTRREMYFSLT